MHSASDELLRALKLALFMSKEYFHRISFLCLIISRFRGIARDRNIGFHLRKLKISIIHITSLFTQLTKNITWKVMRELFSEQSKPEIGRIMYSVSSATKSSFSLWPSSFCFHDCRPFNFRFSEKVFFSFKLATAITRLFSFSRHSSKRRKNW